MQIYDQYVQVIETFNSIIVDVAAFLKAEGKRKVEAKTGQMKGAGR